VATVAVVAASLLIIAGRAGSDSDPLGAAIAQLAVGKSGIKLEQERQKVIMEYAATQAFSVTSVPKLSHVPSGGGGGGGFPVGPPPSVASVQGIAFALLTAYGLAKSQWSCLDRLWTEESNWNPFAENPSGAYGIPQALPGSKMASAGPDWQSDPTTQIKWGLGYIKTTYGTLCAAWNHEVAFGWY